jgi:hypothetical protein
MVWSTIEDSKASVDAKLVAEKVGRWRVHPSKQRQLKEYYPDLTPTVHRSVRGKVQPRIKFRMDNHRIVRFTERIITGPFFVEFNRRIPAGYVVKAVPEEDRKTDCIRDQWRSLFDEQPFRTVGRDAMKYRFVAMHKTPNVTV